MWEYGLNLTGTWQLNVGILWSHLGSIWVLWKQQKFEGRPCVMKSSNKCVDAHYRCQICVWLHVHTFFIALICWVRHVYGLTTRRPAYNIDFIPQSFVVSVINMQILRQSFPVTRQCTAYRNLATTATGWASNFWSTLNRISAVAWAIRLLAMQLVHSHSNNKRPFLAPNIRGYHLWIGITQNGVEKKKLGMTTFWRIWMHCAKCLLSWNISVWGQLAIQNVGH
jgi:hypothetical protein